MIFKKHLQKLTLYEAGKPLELLIREYGISPEDIIKLGSNESSYGTSSRVLEKIKDYAKYANIYPDDSYFELKELLSCKFNVNSKNIIIGNGSDQIIDFCVRSVINDDDKVLTARYTFAMYEIYSRQVNGIVIKSNTFLHNLDYMLKLYKTHSPKLIFICTPNNPLGEALEKNKILEFIKQINENTLIVLDCAYMEYAIFKDKAYGIYPKDILNFKNVIYLGTFSKAYGLGGMRIGYGIANENIIDNLHKLRPPFNITIISLIAAIESLKDEEFVQNNIKNNFIEMEKYINFCENMSLKYVTSYTNFITILLNKQNESLHIFLALLKQGIIIRNLSSYGLNAIRITIGKEKQNEVVLKNLAKLMKN